ncbi:porin [Aliidiomarina haloalkalitolerans]|nr:porin [Aliidiomarina haloalkalitolerans]
MSITTSITTKRVTLASLLPALTFCSFAAIAQDSEPKIGLYGRLHVSADYLNDGSDGGLNVSSNSSRLGLTLDYKVADNLTLIGQIERGIDLSEGSSTITARNTFLGVKGDWGTLRAGYYDTPVKRIINAVEQFRDQIGEGRNISRSGEMHFDKRFKSGLHYTTPTWQNLTLMVHYGTHELTGATVDNEHDAVSSSLTYQRGEWTALIGYESQSRPTEPNLEAMRAALIRKSGAWSHALFYQHADGMATGSQEVFGFTTSYALNSEYSLKGQVFHRTADETGELDSTMITVGIDRKLNAKVNAYLTFSHTDNAVLSTANVSAGGHGKTMTIEPGQDPFAVAVGLRWNF